jgi:endonuclease/exonuclease/phosphatase family metal-dependent hydrolase
MKLISLNIEGHRHLHERVIPFLVEEQPDLVCLQEVFGVDVPHLKHALQMDGLFVPMSVVKEVSIHQSHALGEMGVAVFCKNPEAEFSSKYYVTKPVLPDEELPIFFYQEDPNSMHRVLAWVTLTDPSSGQPVTVATTHFTWSPKGSYTPEQVADLSAMLALTEKLPPHILCGDFNSPRQAGEKNVFAQLAERYTDNIPADYTSSLDEAWHKAGKLELMVDGLFSTPGSYQFGRVVLKAGVSDHKAVVAEL